MSAKFADNRSGAPRDGSSAGGTPRQPSAAGDAVSERPAPKAEDVALVCGVTDDGQGVEVIRKRGDRLETGTVRRLEAGKPIHGEIVRLRPRAQAPLVCDVEVEFTPPAPEERGGRETLAANTGPAQVATESYRKNWDAVYGGGRKPSLLN